ncbi:alginate O-acetyltransferase AlgX-related protein [Rivibacter subsaxonicus]|uniref:Acetyltransferase AlgX (SGNH hydrolase-like protein) n=1 Tax=Rivibacter subsaxonicus TaxID=457575 RepID=A0A4Q7VN17_9BURK|nr:hypothetical protein [Rivibacter subsaxonicus]RZT97604.1 acetyltransferase AlgX (SGNH hydrolase-like protein) [Rivibacter subsaxonicus]
MTEEATFKRQPLLLSGHQDWQWSLDLPRNDKVVRDATLGLRIEGWVLPPAQLVSAQRPVQLWLRQVDAETPAFVLPLNVERKDVISKVLAQEPGGHPQLRCGYLAHVQLADGVWELGYALGEAVMWISRWNIGRPALRLVAVPTSAAAPAAREAAPAAAPTATPAPAAPPGPPPLKVLHGTEGWLFLDNDSNRSVDQFTGRLLLDEPALDQWQAYLDQGLALAASVHARHALVIAPSKEQVLPQHYPHPRAPLTVLDQVLALARPEHHVVDGAALLAAQPAPEACFMRTDTHWTDRGALQAVLAAIEALGFDAALARAAFEADSYRVIRNAGDLGLKFDPPVYAPTEFLVGHSPYEGARFDNRLPNFGRVMIFEQADAPLDDSLLMFGASSGYTMLKYLRRLFKRCVFVHSAGHVDPALVRHEQPGALLLQSNGRFLVEPPRTDFDTRGRVAAKLAEASEGLRAHVQALLQTGPTDAADTPYFAMLGACA